LSLFDLHADRVYHLSLAYTDVVNVATCAVLLCSPDPNDNCSLDDDRFSHQHLPDAVTYATGINVHNIGRVTIDSLQGIVTDRSPEQ